MKLMNRPDVQLNNIILRNTQKNSFIQYNVCVAHTMHARIQKIPPSPLDPHMQ